MTETAINIAIAEACGWKMYCREAIDGNWKSKDQWITAPDGTSQFRCNIPNYCNDLNAMHEAENGLDYFNGDRGNYLAALTRIVAAANDELPPSKYRGIHRATAMQRAEAFLRTKGLWK